VVIEEVLADDQTVFKEGSLISFGKLSSEPGNPLLPAGRGRVLEIRYTANSFVHPAKVRFQHRLRGREQVWRDAWTRRVAFYTDLRPGQYEFEVRACTDEGLWSSQSATFAFRLAPYFWQTRTFYVMSGAAIIGLGAMLQAYRLRWQHRLLKLDEQRALANERARIARDLHDDLGTALTGLALELDVAGQDAKDGPSLAERLSQTAKHARDLAERMREVVWTVNPRCDTVSSLADFLEQQAEQFLRAPGVRVRLQFPEDIPALPLDAKARHHLALCVREALNNVVCHAQATEVAVSLALVDQQVLVEVKDNGRGCQPQERSGHGLANLRTRMEEIGGSFQCLSEIGAGTVVSLRLPLTRSQSGKERSQ
jgi:signal transduction histidine kinase